MVKCSDIISEVISITLDEFGQPQIKHQYEKMFENLVKNNLRKSDLSRLIESIQMGDE